MYMEESAYHDLKLTLKGIEVKLDNFLVVQADHENRIRSLEKYVWAIPVSIVTALVTSVIAILK